MEWTAKEVAPIIVALIGFAGVVVGAIINKRMKAAREQASMPTPTTPTAPPKHVDGTLPVQRPPVLAITHAEIQERLKDLGPFQRDQIERSYVGTRVRWRILLKSVSDYGNGGANVAGVVVDTKSSTSCNGKMSDFRCLMHAADGEEVEVEGTLDLVSSAYTELTDCVATRLK